MIRLRRRSIDPVLLRHQGPKRSQSPQECLCQFSPFSSDVGSSRGANILTNEDYSLQAADFWKPATTQAVNIEPLIDTVRLSQTILVSQPEPSASASKDL